VEVVGGDGRSPLAKQFALTDTLGLLDLGMTRAELRSNDYEGPDRITLMRQDYLIQFRQIDYQGRRRRGRQPRQGQRALEPIWRNWIR